MTLQECYKELGGDYDDVMKRLGSEALVGKFVLKFLDDSTYWSFFDAMRAARYDEAFRGAHTLKGMCQNLSFTKLGQSSAAVCEALREKRYGDAAGLFGQMDGDYCMTVIAIRRFVGGDG